ncbi:vesicle transport protein SFT2B [Lingula anatina]|uniref:Vesicle transport protein n=1 Tax=Lingula anatina TaxID=7574 RepID=A0A1S3J7T5_LINAN|nr:vesicle transport protein SFT2B [Lingula anatina]|eukprot:XP_013406460.1 vesicle transport protein SFT2B [Lingula anatina]
MDKLRKTLSGDDPDEEQGIVTQIYEGTTLSWSTRIKGFLVCFILGILLSVMGSCFLWMGYTGTGLLLFGLFYTLGNIVSILSTMFLMGPCNQLKKMFAETRIIATIVVIVFFALTLMAALWWQIAGLALLFCILQFLALTWYSISYIPFARDAVKKGVTGCLT